MGDVVSGGCGRWEVGSVGRWSRGVWSLGKHGKWGSVVCVCGVGV